MGDPNSLQLTEKFASAYHALLADISRMVEPYDRTADLKTIEVRAAAEGLPFFTVTLPKLGRALDRALATGRPFVCPEGFTANMALPVFLGALWREVFDLNGVLTEDADPAVIRALRQVLYLAYKLEGEYDKAVVDEIIQTHLDVDASLPLPDEGLRLPTVYFDTVERGLPHRVDVSQVVELARLIVSQVFEWGKQSPTGRPFDPADILPKHGPGAVSDRIEPHEKFVWRHFYRQLDAEYPYTEYMYWSYTHMHYALWHYLGLNEQEVGFARLAAVPKDSRGPRLISMEPLEYQWIQQGLGQAIVDWLETHEQTKRYVRFSDQTVNQDLARWASVSGSHETLDMKDASDRVSLWLVRQLFPPLLLRKLEACRSAGTLINGDRVTYRKFAPMGSALCFPVESLCFWALAVAALNLDSMPRYGYIDVNRLPHAVCVFGDDLIVPRGAFQILSPVFESLFLRFNEDKCCRGTNFRESCGCDAFKGVDVTPVRIRHMGTFPRDLVALCSYANAFSKRGYDKTAEVLYDLVESTLGPLPCSSEDLILHKYCTDPTTASLLNLRDCKIRLNADLQRWEYRCRGVRTRQYKRETDQWGELWRCSRITRDAYALDHGKVIDPDEWLDGLTALEPVWHLESESWTRPLWQRLCAKRPLPGHYDVRNQVELIWRWRGLDMPATEGVPSLS